MKQLGFGTMRLPISMSSAAPFDDTPSAGTKPNLPHTKLKALI
jgi:hypothetical protein